MALSLPYAWGTAVGPRRGCVFLAATPEQLACLEEKLAESVDTWVDLQKMSYSFGYGSSLVHGRTHPCTRWGLPCHLLAFAGGPVVDDVLVIIIIHNVRSRGVALAVKCLP